MNVNDYIRLNCTSCGAEIYAEKGLAYWYCGHCGEQMKVIPPQKKPIVIKLKKRPAAHSRHVKEVQQGVII